MVARVCFDCPGGGGGRRSFWREEEEEGARAESEGGRLTDFRHDEPRCAQGHCISVSLHSWIISCMYDTHMRMYDTYLERSRDSFSVHFLLLCGLPRWYRCHRFCCGCASIVSAAEYRSERTSNGRGGERVRERCLENDQAAQTPLINLIVGSNERTPDYSISRIPRRR